MMNYILPRQSLTLIFFSARKLTFYFCDLKKFLFLREKCYFQISYKFTYFLCAIQIRKSFVISFLFSIFYCSIQYIKHLQCARKNKKKIKIILSQVNKENISKKKLFYLFLQLHFQNRDLL